LRRESTAYSPHFERVISQNRELESGPVVWATYPRGPFVSTTKKKRFTSEPRTALIPFFRSGNAEWGMEGCTPQHRNLSPKHPGAQGRPCLHPLDARAVCRPKTPGGGQGLRTVRRIPERSRFRFKGNLEPVIRLWGFFPAGPKEPEGH